MISDFSGRVKSVLGCRFKFKFRKKYQIAVLNGAKIATLHILVVLLGKFS